MQAGLPAALLGALPCGAPPTVDDLLQLRSNHGSNATSLHDLHRAVVSVMPGFWVSAFLAWLHLLRQGEPSHFLNAVIHLSMLKKRTLMDVTK